MAFEGRDDVDAVIVHRLDDLLLDAGRIVIQPPEHEILPEPGAQDRGHGALFPVAEGEGLFDLIVGEQLVHLPADGRVVGGEEFQTAVAFDDHAGGDDAHDQNRPHEKPALEQQPDRAGVQNALHRFGGVVFGGRLFRGLFDGWFRRSGLGFGRVSLLPRVPVPNRRNMKRRTSMRVNKRVVSSLIGWAILR